MHGVLSIPVGRVGNMPLLLTVVIRRTLCLQRLLLFSVCRRFRLWKQKKFVEDGCFCSRDGLLPVECRHFCLRKQEKFAECSEFCLPVGLLSDDNMCFCSRVNKKIPDNGSEIVAH